MFLEDIKLTLRISHNKIDSELTRLEDYACAELIRAGVPSAQIVATNKLIKNAVITRVLLDTCSDSKRQDKLQQSWDYQLDVLRKHGWTSNV